MSIEFRLPDLGENIESGDVVSLLVKPGDRVDKSQPVVELETDKAVIEVPASVSGVVKEVHVKAGDKAKVGQLILTLETDGAGEPPKAAAAPEAPSAPQPEASEPEKAQPESAKKPALVAPSQPARKAEVVGFSRAVPTSTEGVVAAAPSVRRLAREIGVRVEDVAGSGPNGRISQDDVKAFARQSLGAGGGLSAASLELPDFSKWGEVEHQPFSNVRRKTAQHMSRCWLQVPAVTQHDKCDVTELENRRKQYGSKVEAGGGKLTVTAIVLKAVASALRIFPQFNASIDMGREEIVLKKFLNVGVAVDTPRGLLVPVIRDVDHKNITQLSVELLQLAEKARGGKIGPEDLQGGTFTITNLGGIGGTGFTPIVNWPEVAILGLARSRIEPVWDGEDWVPRLMLPLSLTYDHRLIDGADAARFLRWLCEALEDPFLLSLEG